MLEVEVPFSWIIVIMSFMIVMEILVDILGIFLAMFRHRIYTNSKIPWIKIDEEKNSFFHGSKQNNRKAHILHRKKFKKLKKYLLYRKPKHWHLFTKQTTHREIGTNHAEEHFSQAWNKTSRKTSNTEVGLEFTCLFLSKTF